MMDVDNRVQGLGAPAPEPPSNIGKRSFAQGHMTPAINRLKQKRPDKPNRLFRRGELARAPRKIRVLAKLHRSGKTSKLHPHSVKRWLDPEEYIKYLEMDTPNRELVQRRVKNAVRRRRQQEAA